MKKTIYIAPQVNIHKMSVVKMFSASVTDTNVSGLGVSSDPSDPWEGDGRAKGDDFYDAWDED